METTPDWRESFLPLIKQYEKRQHPLNYANRYQLVVMVILSARDSDRHINALAPRLFAAYPTLADLAKAAPEDLAPLIGEVINGATKAQWLVKLARLVGSDENIPRTMDTLTALTGIGRKSANVIIRESAGPAEGVMVDLHVVRVAPRLGVASGDNPEKIERQLMAVLPRELWGEAGMALSFLGREICRPSAPQCPKCPMNASCAYHAVSRSKSR